MTTISSANQPVLMEFDPHYDEHLHTPDTGLLRFPVPEDRRQTWVDCATDFDRLLIYTNQTGQQLLSDMPVNISSKPPLVIRYHVEPEGIHVRSFIERVQPKPNIVRVASFISRIGLIDGAVNADEQLWTETHFSHKIHGVLRVINYGDKPRSAEVMERDMIKLRSKITHSPRFAKSHS